MKGMDSAYLAAVERGDTEAAQNAKTAAGEGSGDGRYQIKKIDGRLMTVIDTQNDTRDFKAAEAYLKTLVNTDHPFSTILMDAQPVYVGKDLPGEYRSSEYTKSMLSKLRDVKMQAATNLDEMLLLAENGEWRKNVKPKHAKDAQNGWYRYDTEFAVPILNAKKAVDHYTVYGGTLLIRNDADGKSYLYDLLDIEKKKVISAASFSAETHSEVLPPKPSTNSISTSDGNVNAKFSLKGMDSAYLTAVERGDTEAAQNAKTAAGEGSGKTRLMLKGIDRDYSYSALVSKPDMKVAVVDDTVSYQAGRDARKNVITSAISAAKNVGHTNENGNAVVHVDDTGTDVILSTKSLRHGLDRRFSINAPVTLKAGEILKNSVRVNELIPSKETIDASYVLIGAAKNEKNEPYIVQFVVNRASNEVTSVDVLYAVNAKTEPAGSLSPEITGVPATLTGSTISISSLLDYVNRYFPDILPEDVLRHYGHTERPAGKMGESALFQLKSARELEQEVKELKKERTALLSRNKTLEARVEKWRKETRRSSPTVRADDVKKLAGTAGRM